MSRCFAGLAVALMVLKMGTWLAIVRFHTSLLLNLCYVVATLLMLWSYLLAVSVQPSCHPPTDNRVRLEEGEAEDGDEEATRYCERCDNMKSAAVHHCSACRRCVYRMVSHSPIQSKSAICFLLTF